MVILVSGECSYLCFVNIILSRPKSCLPVRGPVTPHLSNKYKLHTQMQLHKDSPNKNAATMSYYYWGIFICVSCSTTSIFWTVLFMEISWVKDSQYYIIRPLGLVYHSIKKTMHAASSKVKQICLTYCQARDLVLVYGLGHPTIKS